MYENTQLANNADKLGEDRTRGATQLPEGILAMHRQQQDEADKKTKAMDMMSARSYWEAHSGQGFPSPLDQKPTNNMWESLTKPQKQIVMEFAQAARDERNISQVRRTLIPDDHVSSTREASKEAGHRHTDAEDQDKRPIDVAAAEYISRFVSMYHRPPTETNPLDFGNNMFRELHPEVQKRVRVMAREVSPG